MTNKKLSREELYDLVWSKPASKLAEEFAISDVGLAKLCKRMEVPRPPRGYWAKLSAGKRVQKAQLPDAPSLRKTEINLVVRTGQDNGECDSSADTWRGEAHQTASQKTKRLGAITPSPDLRKAHPIVRKTRDALDKSRPDQYGVLCSGGKGVFPMRVGPDNKRRALLILDAIVRSLAVLGCRFESGEKSFEVIVDGEKAPVRIYEATKRQVHRLTAEEQKRKADGGYIYAPPYDYIPTGMLAFEIDSYLIPGVRKAWKDSPKKRLDDQLNDLIEGLFIASASFRRWRLKDEERKRRWEEECQLQMEKAAARQAEKEKVKQLGEMSTNWRMAQQIRSFVSAVEDSEEEAVKRLIGSQSKTTWLRWAKEQAGRLDPLTVSPPSILDGPDGKSWNW